MTRAEAYEEMRTMFWSEWQAEASYKDEPVEVRWGAVEVADPPPTSKAWVRLSFQENGSYQRTFGEPGARRFERFGVASVQVFVPTMDAQHLSVADELATIARNVFEGQRSTTGNLTFYNVTIREIGVDGTWWNENVYIQFRYDETK